MKSPFKFLDSYTLSDRKIFFGRDQEITELYRRVFESKILLVYGISGTGKSSLINCGLASRFDDSDWLPVNVRRGSNIIDSLNDAFSKQALRPLKNNLSTAEKIKSIYLDHFKPVYLIFDQFEELFIFGKDEEKRGFIKLIKEIVKSETQCRILFIIREEFLAGITEFEYDLPEIFANRFRVEKMKRANAIMAIEGPCKVHGIETESGFSEELIDKLCPAGSEIELTYLQIYLDRILRLAITHFPPYQGGQGGAKIPSQGGTKGGLFFSKSLLIKSGNVSNLLGQFLEEQIREFEDPEKGMAILKSFVSVQGTKKQMTEPEIIDSIRAFGIVLEEDVLQKYLSKFVDHRLLRERDEADHFELRHDALAAKIYEKFTALEKDIIEVRQFIENARYNWLKRNVYLSADDLGYIAPYENRLYLSKELSELIEKSKDQLVRTKRRRRNIVIAATITLLVIFSGFTIWALKERNNAIFQQNQALESRNKAIESERMAIDARNKAIESEFLATKSKELANESRRQAIFEKNKSISEALHSKVLLLIAKAKETNLNNPAKAIRYAQLAYKKDSTNYLANHTLSDFFYSADSIPFYAVSMGHSSSVSSAVFSPDCKSVLTASDDGTAKLWDLSGKWLVTFSGHSDYVNSALFSCGGGYILTASDDKTARLWDLSGECLVTLSGHSAYVESAVFSSDGETILTASADGTAKLWDLSGKCLVTLSGHSEGVYSAVFSPDGKSILTASDDKTAKLWDLSGKCLVTFSGHSLNIRSLGVSVSVSTDAKSNIRSAVFSPDGRSILTASEDKTAKLWDLSGKCLVTLSGHSGSVYSAIFSADGKSILTASEDKTAKLWDLSGKCLVTLSGHSGSVYSAIFSADGKSILTASEDNTAKLWNLSGKRLVTLSGHSMAVYSAVLSVDGKSILTASEDKTAKLWDLSGKRLVTLSGHLSFVNSALYSPDGKSILTASNDGTAKLWDLTGKCLVTFKGHSEFVNSAVFSPDGRSILTASFDNTAKLWDLSGKCLATFTGHSGFVYSAVFSPDGKSILTASDDKTAKLWDLSGKCMATLSGHSSWVSSAIFSPDGRSILTASSISKTAKLWDLSGKCLVTLSGHSREVNTAVYSPDGRFILTASNDKTAKLWDLSGKCLVTLSGHSWDIISAIFSPDGKYILTASADKTAKLWDLSGKWLVTLSGHSSSVSSTVFSADGKYILTASGDNTAKLWDLSGKCMVTLSGHSSSISSAGFSANGKYILTASFDKTAKLWFTPSSISKWLTTTQIGSLSPADKAEIDELDDFKLIQQSDNLTFITDYADWYLDTRDTAKAVALYKRAMELNSRSIDKRILGDIYRMQNKKDAYSELYKENPEAIIIDAIYALQDTSSDNNYTGKYNYYSEMAKLCEKLLLFGSSLKNNIFTADIYNEVGYNGLRSGNYNEALKAIQRGIELDSTNNYLYTKLPLCYLLTGQYEKAKSLYLEYQDKPDDDKTYRETFLYDIFDLESKGITHPDFAKVRELLKK